MANRAEIRFQLDEETRRILAEEENVYREFLSVVLIDELKRHPEFFDDNPTNQWKADLASLSVCVVSLVPEGTCEASYSVRTTPNGKRGRATGRYQRTFRFEHSKSTGRCVILPETLVES